MTIKTPGVFEPKGNSFLRTISRHSRTDDGEIRNENAPSTLASRIPPIKEHRGKFKEEELTGLIEFELSTPNPEITATGRVLCIATNIATKQDGRIRETLERFVGGIDDSKAPSQWRFSALLDREISDQVSLCRVHHVLPGKIESLPNSYLLIDQREKYHKVYYLIERYELDANGNPIDTPLQILPPLAPGDVLHDHTSAFRITRIEHTDGLSGAIKRLKKMTERDAIDMIQPIKVCLRPLNNVNSKWQFYYDSCAKVLQLVNKTT